MDGSIILKERRKKKYLSLGCFLKRDSSLRDKFIFI